MYTSSKFWELHVYPVSKAKQVSDEYVSPKKNAQQETGQHVLSFKAIRVPETAEKPQEDSGENVTFNDASTEIEILDSTVSTEDCQDGIQDIEEVQEPDDFRSQTRKLTRSSTESKKSDIVTRMKVDAQMASIWSDKSTYK